MPDVRDGRVFEKVHDPSLTLAPYPVHAARPRSEEHTSELQSQSNLVCRLLLEKKKVYRQLMPPDLRFIDLYGLIADGLGAVIYFTDRLYVKRLENSRELNAANAERLVSAIRQS